MIPVDTDGSPEALAPLFAACAGKSLAIIGNAASLSDQRRDEDIEAADLVVRMNRAFPPARETHGARTDIHVFSRPDRMSDALTHFKARWYVCMSPKRRDMVELQGVLYYPLTFWEELHANLGSRPSTGMMAIDLFARAPDAELRLFGFDFKATKTYFHDRLKIGNHDFAREAEYVRALCRARGWANP